MRQVCPTAGKLKFLGQGCRRRRLFRLFREIFRDFVYEAVIHKKHLTEAQRKMLEEEPVIINAWDEDH